MISSPESVHSLLFKLADNKDAVRGIAESLRRNRLRRYTYIGTLPPESVRNELLKRLALHGYNIKQYNQ